GGLEMSRPLATAALAVVIVALILILPQRPGRHPGRANARTLKRVVVSSRLSWVELQLPSSLALLIRRTIRLPRTLATGRYTLLRPAKAPVRARRTSMPTRAS